MSEKFHVLIDRDDMPVGYDVEALREQTSAVLRMERADWPRGKDDCIAVRFLPRGAEQVGRGRQLVASGVLREGEVI